MHTRTPRLWIYARVVALPSIHSDKSDYLPKRLGGSSVIIWEVMICPVKCSLINKLDELLFV
jgi:hypothetical protein